MLAIACQLFQQGLAYYPISNEAVERIRAGIEAEKAEKEQRKKDKKK